MSKVILNSNAPEYIPNPVNLDRAIQQIQKAFAENLLWLEIAYGRARAMPEKVNDKTCVFPKVYYGGKEYLNILMNDTKNSQSWFQVMGAEGAVDYAPSNLIQKMQSTVAAIFWIQDIQKVRFTLGNEEYYHLELFKREAYNMLARYPNVTVLRSYDENARDIFKEYTTEEDKEQFLMAPKAGFRFEFLITYNYDCEQ